MSVWDALYPPRAVCRVCNGEGVIGPDLVCDACRAALRFACPERSVPPLDGIAAGLVYTDDVAAAMHRFKYSGRIDLAAFFAQFMRIPPDWQADCMAPVPLHPLKRYLRAYNQSEALCDALAGSLPLPVRTDLLRRTRFTKTQTHMDADERAQNVSGAFAASPRAEGLSVLLVDDVATTHSTLAACATALKASGALRVYALCACRAQQTRSPGSTG